MQQILTPENLCEVMSAYHGFHDADIKHIVLRPLADRTGYLDAEVELIVKNHLSGRVQRVMLLLEKVVEMKFSYDKKFDYPNIRDEIAVGFYNKLVYVDFGSASEPRTSPDDYRSVDSFFICECASIFILTE